MGELLMIWSTNRHWHHGWMARAGLACLGAGGILVSGCTAPLTADLNKPANKSQQVAKSSGSSAKKKSSQKVASKEVAGKARVSDLDDGTQDRILAQRARSKPVAASRPASQPRAQQSQLASASTASQQPPVIRPKGSNDDAKTVAAKPRKPSATTTAAARASSEFAAENLRGNSSIKQTAGNRPLPSIAKNMTVESKRRATEQSSPTFEVADAGAAIASNHERRRADRLMERAHERYRSGYPEEALRLASVAVELEKSGQAVYRLGDER